jgi:hypothetical protein
MNDARKSKIQLLKDEHDISIQSSKQDSVNARKVYETLLQKIGCRVDELEELERKVSNHKRKYEEMTCDVNDNVRKLQSEVDELLIELVCMESFVQILKKDKEENTNLRIRVTELEEIHSNISLDEYVPIKGRTGHSLEKMKLKDYEAMKQFKGYRKFIFESKNGISYDLNQRRDSSMTKEQILKLSREVEIKYPTLPPNVRFQSSLSSELKSKVIIYTCQKVNRDLLDFIVKISCFKNLSSPQQQRLLDRLGVLIYGLDFVQTHYNQVGILNCDLEGIGKLQIDHIQSLATGGNDDLSNLQGIGALNNGNQYKSFAIFNELENIECSFNLQNYKELFKYIVETLCTKEFLNYESSQTTLLLNMEIALSSGGLTGAQKKLVIKNPDLRSPRTLTKFFLKNYSNSRDTIPGKDIYNFLVGTILPAVAPLHIR